VEADAVLPNHYIERKKQANQVTIQSYLENTTCFLGVAYPPHKLDKKYAYECKHSTLFLSNLRSS
jgi:hypothetical protein